MDNPKSWFWYALAVGAIVTLLGVAFAKLAKAQVPYSCVELAGRKGVPIETEAQKIRAERRLWWLSSRDPLVKECREAITRLKKNAR